MASWRGLPPLRHARDACTAEFVGGQGSAVEPIALDLRVRSMLRKNGHRAGGGPWLPGCFMYPAVGRPQVGGRVFVMGGVGITAVESIAPGARRA